METSNNATSFYSGNIYMPTCVECKKKFLSPEAFEKHKTSFKFKCQYCGVTFERAENQLNHVETHMISCFSCPKKFPNESQLKNHVNNLHRFACPECSEDCGSESNLGKHTVKKHMFPCQQCKETLKTEEAYQAHMQSFHGANVQLAAEPSNAPSNDAIIKENNIDGPSENQGAKEDTVKVQKFSQCVECKQLFKSEKDLESHILSLHSNIGEDSATPAKNVNNTDENNAKISCQFCNKEFTDFDVWKKHEEEESMVDIGSSIVDVATNEEMDMSEFFLPNTDASQNNSKDQVISGEIKKEVDENNTRFHDDSQWERVKHFYVEEKTVTARKLETTYRELQRINNLQVKKLEATDLKNLPIAKRSYTKTSKGDEEISNYKKMKYQLPNFAHLGVTIAKSAPNDPKAMSSSGSENQESDEKTPENVKTKENETEMTQENFALLNAVKKIEDKESSMLEDADDIIDNYPDTAEADAEELKEAEKELRRKWMYKMRTKVRCEECKKIVSEYRLEYHKKFHTDRVYRCCICSQGFLTKKQLSIHKYKKYLWTNSHKTAYFKKGKIRSKMDTFTMKIINYPQHKVLVSHFKTFPFLTKKKADEISEQTELPLKAIQIWFQNRRLKNNVSEDAWKDMIAAQPPSAAPNSAVGENDKIDKINQLIGSTPKAPPQKQKKPAINYKNYKGPTTGAANRVPLKTYRGPTNQSNNIRPNLGPLNQVNYLNQINPATYQAGLNQGAFLNQGPLLNQVPIKQEISVKQETIDVDNYQGPQNPANYQMSMIQGANGARMQAHMMQGANGARMQVPMMQGNNGARMPMMQGAPGMMQGALINPAAVKQETIDVDNYAVGTDYDLLIAARFNALQRTYQSLFKTFTDLKQAPLVGQPNTSSSQNPANSRPIITYNNPSMLAGNNPTGAPINNLQTSGNPTILSQRQPNQKYLVPVRVQGNPGLAVNAQGIPLQSVNMQNLTSRPTNMPNNMASNSMNMASRSGNMPNNIGSMPGNMPNGIQFRGGNMNNMTSMPGNMPNNMTSMPGNMTNNMTSMPGNMPNNGTSMPGNMPNNRTSMPGNMPNNMTSMPGNMPNNVPSINGNMTTNVPPSLPSFLRQSNAPNGGRKINGRSVQGNTSVEKNLASNGFGNGQQQFNKSFLSNLDKINGTNSINPQQQQQQNNQQQQQNNLRNLQRINIVPKTINVMSNHPKVEIYKKNIIPS